MATFNLSWEIANTTGTTAVKVKYRKKGTSLWTSTLVAASGTTAVVTGDNNYIYDFQYQNINNDDNPLSTIVNAIGFADPEPTFSPTNTTIGYSFDNLSEDIDSYTVAIASYLTPNVIIESQVKTPAEPVTGVFTGLSPLSQYYIYVTPAADQFSKTFTYIQITEELATCAAPINVTATLS